MSSYLTFYLSDKETGTKRCISSFSRSTEMYQEVDTCLNIPYSYSFTNPGDTLYTEITDEDLLIVIDDIKERIGNMERSIEMERAVSDRMSECIAVAVTKLAKETTSSKRCKEIVSYMMEELRNMLCEGDRTECNSQEFIDELTDVKDTLVGYREIITSDFSDFDKLWYTIG